MKKVRHGVVMVDEPIATTILPPHILRDDSGKIVEFDATRTVPPPPRPVAPEAPASKLDTHTAVAREHDHVLGCIKDSYKTAKRNLSVEQSKKIAPSIATRDKAVAVARKAHDEEMSQLAQNEQRALAVARREIQSRFAVLRKVSSTAYEEARTAAHDAANDVIRQAEAEMTVEVARLDAKARADLETLEALTKKRHAEVTAKEQAAAAAVAAMAESAAAP
jgi:phosphoribosylanthranilate isomerase